MTEKKIVALAVDPQMAELNSDIEYTRRRIAEAMALDPSLVTPRFRYPCEPQAETRSRLDRFIDEKLAEIAAVRKRRHYQEDKG